MGLVVCDPGRRARGARVKDIVWFWLIDETLSANLVYRSDYEIGSTTQVMKQWRRS